MPEKAFSGNVTNNILIARQGSCQKSQLGLSSKSGTITKSQLRNGAIKENKHLRSFVILFGKPNRSDGIYLYDLVSQCPPLDLNSKYVYHLVAAHFKDTSVVVRPHSLAEKDQNNPQNQQALSGPAQKKPVGFISAYCLPSVSCEEGETKGNILFIWQVALLPEYRGRGLAAQMVEHLLQRECLKNTQYIHTTISPSNRSSENLFLRLAQRLKAPVCKEEFLNEQDFIVPAFNGDDEKNKNKNGPEKNESGHEKEILYKIGPIDPQMVKENILQTTGEGKK